MQKQIVSVFNIYWHVWGHSRDVLFYPREMKKAKMDDQPSTVQPDTADTFTPNETYTRLLQLVPQIDEYPCYLAPICLLGEF